MIIEHPSIRIMPPGKSYTVEASVVQCDLCRDLAPRCGQDPGDAAEEARKRGWRTQKAKDALIGDPKIWACKACIKKQQPQAST